MTVWSLDLVFYIIKIIFSLFQIRLQQITRLVREANIETSDVMIETNKPVDNDLSEAENYFIVLIIDDLWKTWSKDNSEVIIINIK